MLAGWARAHYIGLGESLKPLNLRAVMQAAEKLGSTLATVGQSWAQKRK